MKWEESDENGEGTEKRKQHRTDLGLGRALDGNIHRRLVGQHRGELQGAARSLRLWQINHSDTSVSAQQKAASQPASSSLHKQT
jgi:hypothetical protein